LRKYKTLRSIRQRTEKSKKSEMAEGLQQKKKNTSTVGEPKGKKGLRNSTDRGRTPSHTTMPNRVGQRWSQLPHFRGAGK